MAGKRGGWGIGGGHEAEQTPRGKLEPLLCTKAKNITAYRMIVFV